MKAILCVFLTISFFSSLAQDDVFVHKNGSLLNLNPSFAGSNGGVRDQLSFRDAGSSLDWDFINLNNNFDCYFKKIHAGIGLSTYLNLAGDGVYKNTSYALTYAQHIKLKESGWFFVPSVQFAYLKSKIDWAKSNWQDPLFDPSPMTIHEAYDGSAGFLLKYKTDLYGGLYFFHINQPAMGLYGTSKLPIRYSANLSYSLHFGEKALLQFLAVYNNQDKYGVFHFTATLVTKRLITGLGIRLEEGLNFILGYRADLFTVSAGYDFSTTRLAGSYGNAYEIHLSYNLRDKEHRHVLTNIEAW